VLDKRTADVNQLEFRLTGPLYVNEVQALQEGLTRCIDDGNKRLSLDFSQVEYLDCSGLGALVCVHKRAREQGGQLVIKGVQGRIRYLFERTRLDKTLLIL
jgi:anti-sigma B factor antagonist